MNEEKNVEKINGMVVVSQNNCPACSNLEVYLENEHEDFEYIHVNIDEDRNSIKKYDVTSTPTIILYDEGEVLMRTSGFNFGNTETIDTMVGMV